MRKCLKGSGEFNKRYMLLQRLSSDIEGNAAALTALAGCLSFLQEALLDRSAPVY